MRRRTGPFGTTDALLAGTFAAAAAVEAVLRYDGDLGPFVLQLAGASAMVVLLLRRRRPLLAMSLFCLSGAVATWVQATVLDAHDDAFVPVLTLFVLSFSLGAYAGSRGLLLGAPQPLALVLGVDLLEPGQSLVGAAIFVSVFVVLLPVLAGRLVRSRRRLVAELRRLERAAALEHRRRLRMVRAEESLAVSDMLTETLEASLQALLRTEHIADVERQARTLLATTRDSVVSLARDAVVPEEALVPEDVEPRQSRPASGPADSPAFTWTLLVAAGLGAGVLTETDAGGTHAPAGLALTALLVCGVVWMARRPLEGALLAWASATVMSRAVVPLGDTFSSIGLTVVVPFLACWLGDRRRSAVAVVAGVAAAVAGVRTADPLGAVVLTALATVAGTILRDRSALLTDVREARLVSSGRRQDELRIAALEERAAIGRELHDSIGHALTVIALQAGAARRIEAADPDAAGSAREIIERTAREALAELRRGFETTSRTAEDLVSTARAAGLDVTLHGPPPPPELAAVVYRVVQETLTNALRHAPGARVRIELGGQGSSAEPYRCTVSNTAPAEAPTAYLSAGRGLAGMRSRVQAIGGTVTWGPADGGFVVSATFPRAVEVSR